MSTENYEDQRAILKALRHGMIYGMGTQVASSILLDFMESRMKGKFVTTGGLRYGKSLGHPSNYAKMKFRHVLANTQYEMTGLKLAKIHAQAKKQAYLMRTQQMLPLTFFGDKYL